MEEAEKQLHDGDLAAALEIFCTIGRDPEHSELASTRLGALVDDPAYAAYRDEMLESLAEIYLIRTQREAQPLKSAVSEEASPI